MRKKKCKICGVSKCLDSFSPHYKGSGGKHPYCRTCRAEQNREQANEWRRKNKSRAIATTKQWRKEQRERIRQDND